MTNRQNDDREQRNIDTLSSDIRYLRQSHDEFRSEAKAELKEIRLQTQKTNGRMNKAEQEIYRLAKIHNDEDNNKDKRSDRYVAPIISGLSVGLMMLLADFLTRQ